MFDIIIKNGLYFDGSAQAGLLRHIGIAQGSIARISEQALSELNCPP